MAIGLSGGDLEFIGAQVEVSGQMREFQFASQFVDAEAKREQSAIDQIGHKGA